MSQFGAEKFTTRSREVIEAAQLSATKAGNTSGGCVTHFELRLRRSRLISGNIAATLR